MLNQELLLSIIAVLLGGIGYLIKRILDRTDTITEDIEEVREDIADMKPKIETLWALRADTADTKSKTDILWELRFASNKSPLQLNEEGLKVFETSGIKEIVDGSKPRLLEALKEKNPQNAYQLQEGAKEVLLTLKQDPATVLRLEEGAYNAGVDVDSVLFVGSLYFRNLALPEFQFPSEGLGSPDEDASSAG
jgi:hypothetical protein